MNQDPLDEWLLNMQIVTHTVAMRDKNPIKRAWAKLKWRWFVLKHQVRRQWAFAQEEAERRRNNQ